MISQLPSPGIALVVPGYLVCAGILLCTAITAGVLGLYRRRNPLYLAFAATCFFSSVVVIGIATAYTSSSVPRAVEVIRWGWAGADLFVAALFSFIAIYADSPQRRRVFALTGALSVLFVSANFVLPYGQRFAAIDQQLVLHLPWGEAIYQLKGGMTGWAMAFRALSAIGFAWALWTLQVLHHKGKSRDALVLAVYLIVVFASSMHGLLIDIGVIHGFHSIPFALVGLTVLMSANLGARIHEQNLELARTGAKLRERAFIDPLTALPNRFSIQERLAALIDGGPQGSHGGVLICDLDHFKVINNALSHEVGDELLREVAARLLSAARGRAGIARMGGNTFLAVLDEMNADEAVARARIQQLAEDISREIGRTALVGAHSIDLSVSIGVSTFPALASSTTEVIAHADMALNRAKKRGRSNVQVFVPAFRNDADERFRIIEGLRRAEAARELALHYQPQMDAAGHMVGAEALMRWNSLAMGPISPGAFIPIAEETGLIHSLGEWSLCTGCDQMARWKRDGAPFEGYLSINVSPWQLARANFVERLVAAIDASGVDPARLTLEITESAVLFDVQETVAKLREIRPLGVRIALDDFGTGYSSLALIKDLPLDAIKIDQSFVRHIEVGANKHLIRVVVAIGSELGLDVIAEGVETEVEREILTGLGCTRLQGYLFCRPLPEQQFSEWLWARRPQVLLAQG